MRSGSPSLDAAQDEARAARRQPAPAPPKGTELVTTAVQAAGELAQIGLTLGGQVAQARRSTRLPEAVATAVALRVLGFRAPNRRGLSRGERGTHCGRGGHGGESDAIDVRSAAFSARARQLTS